MKHALILLISTLLFSNELDTLNLLNDLNDASEIATKTKLNINKTPSVVTILHADELKKLGITNLYTALGTIPGVELSIGLAGAKQIIMRGNKSLIRDKLKLMIDGISVNCELSGSSYFYLDMPIELIERIEIIRGPASALYGSFAHVGVINIITKSATHKGATTFTHLSSEGYKDIGFSQNIQTDSLKLALDGYFAQNKNSRTYKNYSLLPSSVPFTSHEDYTNKSLGINLEFKNNISLKSRFTEMNTQNYFGYGNWPVIANPKKLKTSSFVSELCYAPKLSSNVAFDLKAGYKEYTFQGLARLKPYSIQQLKPPYPPFDLIGDGYYTERVLYTDVALKYTLKNHSLMFGTYLSGAKEGSTTYYTNNPTVSEVTDQRLAGDGIKAGIKREQYALYFSDIYTLSDKWTANIGLRYDYYNDAQESVSPKLALLFNQDEMQSYKIIYQRSFRVPSWLELYGTTNPFIGNTNLQSETIDTLEFAYRYQKALQNYFNINFYYNQMKNFITRDSSFKFVNGQDIKSFGTEVELKIPLNEETTLSTNYSYIHMNYKDGTSVPLIANHLINIMLLHNFNSSWSTATKLKYVGKCKRESGDLRESLSDYTTLDQTLTFTHKAFMIQATLNNIFDENIIYPAPLGNGSTVGTYKEDLAQNGRTLWISLEWSFE